MNAVVTTKSEQFPLFLIEVSPNTAQVVWGALCATLGSEMATASIDVYPSPTWASFESLPEEVREAANSLEAIGRLQAGRRRDPLMAVTLDCSDAEHLKLLRAFGPFSIHVEVYRSNGSELIGMHDEGTVCWALLSEREFPEVQKSIERSGVQAEIRLEERKRWWRPV